MSIIPEILQPIASIINQYRQPLLVWFSQSIYQRMIVRSQAHPLVQLQKLLDFRPLEQACAEYHPQKGGPGHPVVHSVAKLLRALFIKYFYDLSLRELEEKIHNNMLVKWFVGYGLHEDAPDHTTLHRFEAYLYVHHPRLFFDTVLSQIDGTVNDGHSQVQIGDTFALRANAALESLLQRLRHSSQQLLQAWAESDPTSYAAHNDQLDEAALFGLKTDKHDYALSREEWRQRLLLTLQAVMDCLALLPAAANQTSAVALRVNQLKKIMADELSLTRDDDGCLVDVALLSAKKRGTFRICSATDPEATIRNHGEGKKDFGYNISVAATPDLIREIRADTGSTSDVTPIPDLLTAQIEQGHGCPDKLIYDQVAGHGKTARAVADASNGRTQLVAKPKYPKKSATFAPENFTLSDDGFWLTCPNGRLINRRYRSGEGDGWKFRFLPAQCLSCRQLIQCRGSDKTPTTHRDVFINDYRADFDRLVAYSQTDDFKLDMKLRPQVERVIAGLVLHNGARFARFRGLAKVDFQVKMCATIYNAKRWLTLLAEKEGRHKRPVRRRWELPTPARA